MSELRAMATALLEHPLVAPPRTDELRRRSQKRRRRRLLGTGGSLSVIAMVVVLLVTELPVQNRVPTFRSSTRLAAFIRQGVNVPDSVLEAVGRPEQVRPLNVVHGQQLLSDGGNPVLVYVGAQWCPPCALQRWALVVALSRFGSFSNLGQFVIPGSTTGLPLPESWSFVGSTYTSSLLSFDPADPASLTAGPDGQIKSAVSLTPLQQQAFDALEGTDRDHQGVPFTDLANRFWISGSQAPEGPDGVLDGLSLDQIAVDLSNPSSPVAQLIDGAANYLIADICSVVGAHSVPICSFDTVTG